jgi:hypothetical protein
MLKKASALIVSLVTVLPSEDGVNFTNIPGGISVPGSVGILKFSPVASSFVRVEIWNLIGSGSDLQEMAVFPD